MSTRGPSPRGSVKTINCFTGERRPQVHGRTWWSSTGLAAGPFLIFLFFLYRGVVVMQRLLYFVSWHECDATWLLLSVVVTGVDFLPYKLTDIKKEMTSSSFQLLLPSSWPVRHNSRERESLCEILFCGLKRFSYTLMYIHVFPLHPYTCIYTHAYTFRYKTQV